MASQVIFNGLTSPSAETVTDWFTEGNFFYLEYFGSLGGEIEIDCWLNIVVEAGVTRIISLNDSSTTNIIDSERLFRIPIEFTSPSLEKRLILLVGEEVSIKITVASFGIEATIPELPEDLKKLIEEFKRVCIGLPESPEKSPEELPPAVQGFPSNLALPSSNQEATMLMNLSGIL